MPDAPAPDPPGDAPPASIARWRLSATILLGILVWPAAWFGLYRQHSAPAAFLLYHGLCLGGGMLLRSPGLPPATRLRPLDRRLLLAAVFAANLVVLVLYLRVGEALLDRPHVLSLLQSRGLPPSTYWYLFPYFALVNPLVEEFFWRGGVYATLRHYFRRETSAALAASFFFGAWHWLVIRLFVSPLLALAATLLIMGVGFALTIVYEQTRRLAYPIILHAFAGDAPLLLLLLLMGRN